MNPLLEQALGSIVRHLLGLAVPILVTTGIWTPEETTAYVTAAAAALLAVGWALYQKWASRSVLVTALGASNPMSEEAAKAIVAKGNTPSPSTPENVVPS